MIGRRNFLRAAPAALVGGRAAANALAEKLAGMGATVGVPVEPSYAAGPMRIGQDSVLGMLKKLMSTGIPAWRVQQAKATARHTARKFDPDIATMQSISLSAKYQMQMRRNVARELDSLLDGMAQDAERAEWCRKHDLWI